MTVQLEQPEYGWLNEVHAFASGVNTYWLGGSRPPSSQNNGYGFSGWNLAASADTLNVAGNTNRSAAGFP